MKTANMEAGNRHLGRSSSLLFGGSTPSLLNSSIPNNNGSIACLVSAGKEKRHQRLSPAAELVSDFVWLGICSQRCSLFILDYVQYYVAWRSCNLYCKKSPRPTTMMLAAAVSISIGDSVYPARLEYFILLICSDFKVSFDSVKTHTRTSDNRQRLNRFLFIWCLFDQISAWRFS